MPQRPVKAHNRRYHPIDFFDAACLVRLDIPGWVLNGYNVVRHPCQDWIIPMSQVIRKHKFLQLLHGWAHRREALAELDFDEIWIDTPPALHFYTRSALIAADACLIPFDCDEFARRALYTLLDNVAEIRADHNAGLEVEGIVVNQFQPRATLPPQVVAELKGEGLPVLDSHLSASVKIKESHQQAKPMIHLDRSHKLSREFETLYDELAARRGAGAVAAARKRA